MGKSTSLPSGAKPKGHGMFRGLVRKFSSKQVRDDQVIVIDKVPLVYRILGQAVKEQASGLLTFGRKTIEHSTSFVNLSNDEVEIDGDTLLHISPLGSESESQRIMEDTKIHLDFFTGGYRYGMETSVMEVLANGFNIACPTILSRKKDQRGGARFDVDGVDIKVLVVRESNAPIKSSTLKNISVTGFTFTVQFRKEAVLRQNARVVVKICYGEDYESSVELDGRSLRRGHDLGGGYHLYVVKFDQMQGRDDALIGEAVAFLQREILKRKSGKLI